LQIVVEFKAKWCGSCRLMAPSFAELSRKHLQLLFVTIDVDEVPVKTLGSKQALFLLLSLASSSSSVDR
jgi:thiol-disulfide isomerase/thioredoxin